MGQLDLPFPECPDDSCEAALDSCFDGLGEASDPGELSSIVQIMEERLEILTRLRAMNALRGKRRALHLIGNAEFISWKQHYFRVASSLGMTTFRLEISEVGQQGGSLELRLRALDNASPFQTLEISLPLHFEREADDALTAAAETLTKGYRWIQEFAKDSLRSVGSETAMVLNAELRKSLSVSKPKLIDSVYLALSKGRETSYYVDGTAVGLIFDRLAKTTFRLGISSARHATELLTANVATTDTFSQRALSNGGFYLADLNSSGYLNKLPAFDLSERSMFSSGLLCFETIGQCNGSFLTAFYRRDHESELRSALHAAKPKLCKKFSRRISGFEKVTDYFRRLRKPAAIELVSEIAAETIVKTTDKFAGRP